VNIIRYASVLFFFAMLVQDVRAIDCCRINIIDAENGWPVPLVELRTTHNMRFVSDNAGVIAFDLPELMNVQTWFTVERHGYGVPADGFGFRGVKLVPVPGKDLTVKVRRELPAKRLGRITGGGIFGESQKLGLQQDWSEQGILGCDSVQNAVHNGRLFWAWGDTVLPGYPLGRFQMIGASTGIQPLASFEPPVRLRFDYFTDEAKVVRNIASMPGNGPTWLDGFASLPDKTGTQRLVATYSKIKAPLDAYEVGLCTWNEQTQVFDQKLVVWKRSDADPAPPVIPHGHSVLWKDETGKLWALFGDPFPDVKFSATYEDWLAPDSWQVVDSRKSVASQDNGEQVKPHRGAIAWNAYRKKWVTIFTQFHGTKSLLGEIWYAEADSPFGPWTNAIKVVTHSKYTFYNPQLHTEFTVADSPILLFEATYTHTFSATSEPTPRHDYNQILYRLDLDKLHQ
jgi:hypothetical protein